MQAHHTHTHIHTYTHTHIHSQVDGFSFHAEMQLIHQDPTGANLIIGVLFNTDNDVTHSSMQVHTPSARPPSVTLCYETPLSRPVPVVPDAERCKALYAQVLTVTLAHRMGQAMLDGFPMTPATPPTVRPPTAQTKK